MVYSSGSAVRDDVSGPGTWAFMPATLPTGEIVVINAGFVQNTMQDRAQQDRAVTRLITRRAGDDDRILRFPESAGSLTPPENMAKRLWFTRDHMAMARTLGWGEGGEPVAPFYIDLEAPVRRRAASRNPARSRFVSRTTTCNTPSPGSALRPWW